MKKKAKILLASYLSVFVIALALYAWAGQWGLNWYRRSANESANLAYEETVRSVEALSAALDKSLYATDSDMCDRICCESYACAAAAESAMSTLPFSTWELEQLSAFLNTAGDYAYSLCGQGQIFTSRQRQDLRAMADAAAEFSAQLLDLREKLHDRTLIMDSREKRLQNVGQEQEEHLSTRLLSYEADFAPLRFSYDGQFSEKTQEKSHGLLTEDEMKAAAAEFAGLSPEELQEEYRYEGTDGRLCFRAGDRYLCVSRGGVESMSQNRIVCEENLSMEQAQQAALDFLMEHAYGDLVPAEQAQSGCVGLFSFAREQDGALCPDSLLRVGIALDDGSVYSFDASDYRPEPCEVTWTVDEDSARAAVGETLAVQNVQRKILLSPGGKAVPCYVFSCTDPDGRGVEICIHGESGKQYRIDPQDRE